MELKDILPFLDPEILKRWTELQETRNWDLVDWTKPKTFTDLANIVRNSGQGGDVREALAKMFEEVSVMVGARANEEQARQILDLIGRSVQKGEAEISDFSQTAREYLANVAEHGFPVMGEGAVAPINTTFFNPPNFFDKSRLTVGSYTAQGNVMPNSAYSHTSYLIPVEVGKSYIINGNIPLIGDYFDANGNWVYQIKRDQMVQPHTDFNVFKVPSFTSEPIKFVKVNIMSGTIANLITTPPETVMLLEGTEKPIEYIPYSMTTGTIKASVLPDLTSGLEAEIEELKTKIEATSSLKGKKLVTAGDSLTACTGYTSWGQLIADRNGMDYLNLGIGGSTISNVDPARNPFVDRWQNIPLDADYITIWFGWNDQAVAPLGTMDSQTPDTFYGAWRSIMPQLITRHPNAKIGLIIPFLPSTKQDYAKAVKDIANYYGRPYLDLNASPVPVFNYRVGVAQTVISEAIAKWTHDGLHFNQDGCYQVSTSIEDFIKSM